MGILMDIKDRKFFDLNLSDVIGIGIILLFSFIVFPIATLFIIIGVSIVIGLLHYKDNITKFIKDIDAS